MSLLYKKEEDVVYEVTIKKPSLVEVGVEPIIEFSFIADCGKHGCWETMGYYKLTPKRLLEVIHSFEDYEEHEI
jgi:hypothetical protein